MISIEQYYDTYVASPVKSKLSILDKFDEDLEKFKDNRPKEMAEFRLFWSDKQEKLSNEVDKKKKAKIDSTHFGVTLEFVRRLDSRINELNNLKSRISAENFDVTLEIIPSLIAKEFNDEKVKYMEHIASELESVMMDIEKTRQAIQDNNIRQNEAYREQVRADNEVFDILAQKKEELLQYSDDIVNVCAMYGVSPIDVDVDNNTFTTDELNNLYDKYIDSFRKEQNSKNFVRQFRSKITNQYIQIGIVLLMLILCFTPILNIVSLLFFGGIGWGQLKNKNRVKYYSVLGAITFKIDPYALSTSSLNPDEILPEEITDEMIDEDERFQGFCTQLDEIDARSEFPKEAEYNNILQEYSMKSPAYRQELENNRQIFNRKKEVIIFDIDSEIKEIAETKANAIADYEIFGKRFLKTLVFDSVFTFGLEGDIGEQMVDVGRSNIIFRPYQNEEVMKRFMQVMYINAVTHVNPNNIVVHVYDPNGQGRSLMPLYHESLNEALIFGRDNLVTMIDELRAIADDNLKSLQGLSIYDYNEKAEKEGLTPKKYHLLFILSQPKNVEEDEAIKAFFDYSTDCGIIIWMVSDTMSSPNACVFRRPFQGVDSPIGFVNDNYCREFAKLHVDKRKELNPSGGILWKDFINNVFGEEMFWTQNGSEFIDFYPGYLNGDPTEYPKFPFGNEGDIHMLGVGGTGAGKSVFINHCIATSTYLYSPKELELWLADFKGVEFKFYLGSQNFPAVLPHMAACLCTADADFATSLFKAFRDMADFRYDEMKEAGVKNMPGWNQLVNQKSAGTTEAERRKPEKLIELHKKDKNPYDPLWSQEDYWPRVLFIVDEFQVIFEKADPKNLESINADITQISKVARAAGAHIFFTSQSMKKTVSADILNQFSLRFGLRCAEDTSLEIMGSKLSSSITAKNGWLYVKTQALKPEQAKFIKTPFIQDQEEKEFLKCTQESEGVLPTDDYITAAEKMHASPLHYHIAKCAQEAKNRGFMRKTPPVTYSESDVCKFQQLVDTYNRPAVVNKLPKSGVFFLGDRMAYSSNQAPENIILGAKNNTHIFSVFSVIDDIPMFYKSIIYNIKNNKIEKELVESTGRGQTILIHTANMDLGYICECENDLDESLSSFYDAHCTPHEVIAWVEKLFSYRKENGIKDKPVWIICMDWNKAKGIGVDADATLRGKMDTLFNTCGEFNIHFIWILSGLGKISTSIVGNFNFRICGKVDSDTSIAVLGSKLANKSEPKNGWMYVFREGISTRLKIYQSEITREIAADEIVL